MRVSDRVNCCCGEVAIVERLKQEVMYGPSAMTKRGCRCEEVVISGGSTLFKSIVSYFFIQVSRSIFLKNFVPFKMLCFENCSLMVVFLQHLKLELFLSRNRNYYFRR